MIRTRSATSRLSAFKRQYKKGVEKSPKTKSDVLIGDNEITVYLGETRDLALYIHTCVCACVRTLQCKERKQPK